VKFSKLAFQVNCALAEHVKTHQNLRPVLNNRKQKQEQLVEGREFISRD
jgi:hypothetical protein